MLRSNSKSPGNRVFSPEEQKRKYAVGRICRKGRVYLLQHGNRGKCAEYDAVAVEPMTLREENTMFGCRVESILSRLSPPRPPQHVRCSCPVKTTPGQNDPPLLLTVAALTHCKF